MKRILRILGSRLFLAGICIALEVGQLIALLLLIYDYSMPLTILGWVIQFVLVVYVINRDDIPEFKLPWLLLLLLIPVAGALFFLLFSAQYAGRKERALYAQARQSLDPWLAPGPAVDRLREADPQAARQAEYLRTAAGVPCWDATKIDYYPVGEDFFPALCRALESAERFILIEYFIIQSGTVWDEVHDILRRKAAQGVSVFLMYDDFGCMATLPPKFGAQLFAEGINVTASNRIRPVFSRRYNNRDHRKIVVVDGLVAFTGGINLADRYMNREVVYGHWKDSAVRLEGPAVKNLTAMFLSAWNTQSAERIDCTPYMDVEPPAAEIARGFVVPFGDGPTPLYDDYVCRNVFLNTIYGATRYIYITTPYLICDHELLSALRTAAKKGVDVRIITPHIPDKKAVFLMTRSNYAPLVRDGVRIWEYTPGFIHAKNFIADDAFAVCGSINLDYRSLVHNYECGVWMYGTDCISDMREDFLATIAKSEEVMPASAELRGIKRLLAELMKVFSPLL